MMYDSMTLINRSFFFFLNGNGSIRASFITLNVSGVFQYGFIV